jgi:hypothetical protein
VFTLQYWCYLSSSWVDYQGGGGREYVDSIRAAEDCILLAAAMGRTCRVVDEWEREVYRC